VLIRLLLAWWSEATDRALDALDDQARTSCRVRDHAFVTVVVCVRASFVTALPTRNHPPNVHASVH
jgi:hypothetical protein